MSAQWRLPPSGRIALLAGTLLACSAPVAAQLGDLVESLLKRDARIKDSSDTIPGHGGVLDRCDSLLLTAPVLYYVLFWGQALFLQ